MGEYNHPNYTNIRTERCRSRHWMTPMATGRKRRKTITLASDPFLNLISINTVEMIALELFEFLVIGPFSLFTEPAFVLLLHGHPLSSPYAVLHQGPLVTKSDENHVVFFIIWQRGCTVKRSSPKAGIYPPLFYWSCHLSLFPRTNDFIEITSFWQ